MPTYSIQGPDGKTYSIDGPEGATREQVIAKIKERQGMQSAEPEADDAITLKGLGKQAALGLADVGADLSQTTFGLGGALLGGPVGMQLAQRYAPNVSEKLGLHSEENEPRNKTEAYTRTGVGFVANPLSYVGGEARIPLKALDALLASGGAESMHQILKDTGSPMLDAIGQFAGAALFGQAREIPRALRNPSRAPDPKHTERVETLRQEFDIEPSAGDVTNNSFLKKVEGTGGTMPGSGQAALREAGRVGDEVSNAMLRQMGSDADMRAPGADMFEAVSNRLTELGTQFEEVAHNPSFGGEMDGQMQSELLQLRTQAANAGLNPDQLNRIDALIDRNVRAAFTPRIKPGSRRPQLFINGERYLTITQKNSNLDLAMKDDNAAMAYFASAIRGSLDDAVTRYIVQLVRDAYARGTPTGPSRARAIDAAEMENLMLTARQQWYAGVVIRKALASAGPQAAEGRISLPRVRQIIAASEDDKLSYALQRSPLQRLARAGTAVLTALPNSTTAERGFFTHVAERAGRTPGELAQHAYSAGGGLGASVGFATGNPFLAALTWAMGTFTPGLVGRAVLTPTMQGYLKRTRQPTGREPGPGPVLTQGVRSMNEVLEQPADQ